MWWVYSVLLFVDRGSVGEDQEAGAGLAGLVNNHVGYGHSSHVYVS